QVLRQQAIETGALVDTPEQTVSVEPADTSSGETEDTVVIQPADAEAVYVPQYDSRAVYDTSRYGVGNALLTGAMVFGTVALIDEIFDDDDGWYDYWGCRNCGGWHGKPIIRYPYARLDRNGYIDIDKTVNFNRDIDRERFRNEIGEGGRLTGWQPDEVRRDQARDRLSARGSINTRDIGDRHGDQLRQQLSSRSGAADISRSGSAGALRDTATGARPKGGELSGRDVLKQSGSRKEIAVNRPSQRQAPAKRPSGATQNAPRTALAQHSGRPQSGISQPSLRKNASGARANAASGRSGGGHAIRKR
ncbi:DUF3300 domain-containing protein, partial [Cribrihabitans sp. XS_ASV171]